MSTCARSTALITTAAALGALVAAPLAPPPDARTPSTMHAQVRLTAAPALGAIPIAFLRNQVQYCSIICPYVVQGVVTIPLGAVQAPVAFLDAITRTGSLPQAIGAAAASVTGPARAAAEGIILNDVDRVVPKAFNNLEVAVVQVMDVATAVLTPAELPAAIGTARQTIVNALNQPLPPPVPTDTGARTLPQVVAVEAVKVTAAVAFQAGELVLLGVVQTADAGAQELARSGDPGAAVAAAADQVGKVVDVAAKTVTESVDTAAENIGAALKDPFPKPVTTISIAKNDDAQASAVGDAPAAQRARPRPIRPPAGLRSAVESTARSLTATLGEGPGKAMRTHGGHRTQPHRTGALKSRHSAD